MKRNLCFETAGRKSMMCRLRMVEARMEISDRFKVRSRKQRNGRGLKRERRESIKSKEVEEDLSDIRRND